MDGYCKACGGQYHTTRRLLAHLKYRRDCAVGHVFRQSQLEQLPPGRNAQTEDKDRPLPIPCQSGGKPPQPTEEMEKHFREMMTEDAFTPALCHLLQECAEDHTRCSEDITEHIRQLILSQTQSSESVHAILQTVHQQLLSKNLVLLGGAVQFVLENWTTEWLFGDEAKQVSYPKGWFETTSAEAIKADVVRNLTTANTKGPDINYIPRIHYKELLAVHFFSGTRREGDFQQWVSRIVVRAGLLLTLQSLLTSFLTQSWETSQIRRHNADGSHWRCKEPWRRFCWDLRATHGVFLDGSGLGTGCRSTARSSPVVLLRPRQPVFA